MIGGAKEGSTNLGQQAAAAPNIQRVPSSEDSSTFVHAILSSSGSFLPLELEYFIANELGSRGIHTVKEGKLAALVPPLRRKARKVGDFRGVY